MRFLQSIVPSVLLVTSGLVSEVAAAGQKGKGWGFDEAIITVSGRGSGVGSGLKDKLSDHVPLTKDVTLNANDVLKIVLTATENGKGKRPNQAFLLLRDQDTGVEATFPFVIKESGKGKVDFTQKDLPTPLLVSTEPLRATLLLASFGTSQSFSNHVFNLAVKADPAAGKIKYEKPLRYGKLEEIHHIFKPDPKSGPVLFSLIFLVAVLATLPLLGGVWLTQGANLDHLAKATSDAPIAHVLFFTSILAIEGIFALYYYSWTLFQTLPAVGAVGLVTFLSGSKALSEVQGRRLRGER